MANSPNIPPKTILKAPDVGFVTVKSAGTTENEKEALIDRLKNEIANTESRHVKFRNIVYIAALEEADNLIIEALLQKLATIYEPVKQPHV